MSFMFANSGDFRNPSHADLLDKALASVRRMAQDYAAQQNKAIIADLARAVADLSYARETILATCSERDALAAERDQLISRLNLEKGAGTLLLAERDRLASQLAPLRAALQLLYDETADYITLNHLGDVHHNQSMQRARDALADTQLGAPNAPDQLAELRAIVVSLHTLLADLRPAIVARATTDPLGLDESLLPRIDAALAS